MNYIDIFQNHFKEVFPETFLVIATIIILLYAVFATGRPMGSSSSSTSSTPAWVVTHAGKLAVLALSLTAALSVWQIPGALGTALSGALKIDDLTILVRTLILVSALASTLISFSFIEGQRINSFEYILLILFSTLSMLLVTSSYDLISMYLAIELQTLSFYVLAAFRRNNEFSTEAGLKYFVLGALSSGLLLFGESIIYGSTGITNFEELTKLFTFWSHDGCAGQTVSMGALLMLIAFLFKISAVPFHMWAPDVYEGAPTCVTAFFAITPKVAILSLLMRLCFCTFWDALASWEQLIIVCSLLSMFVGSLGSINQNRIKRLFAYSSIAHVGYLLIALATGTIEAAESLLLYIIIYMLMVINVFGVLLVLSCAQSRPRAGTAGHIWRGNIFGNPIGNPLTTLSHVKPKDECIKYITDFGFLSKTNPVLAASVATILFSNAGIPPLAGFYGKLNIFLSAVSGSMYFLAVAGVLCATMGAFYSIRLVKIIYYHPSRPHWESPKQISKESAIVLAFTFFFTLFFFLYPSFLFIITHSAALTLAL